MTSFLKTLVLVIFLFGCSSLASPLQELKLCYDEWPPSTIFPTSQDSRRGFTIEMMTDIFSQAGYKIKYTQVPYARGIELVRQGSCHLLAEVPEGQEKGVLFPEERTFSYKQVFFKKKGNPWRYTGPSSLKGLKVGTIAGYDYSSIDSEYQHFLTDAKNRSSVIIMAGDNAMAKLMRMIASGRVDTFNEAHLIGSYVVNKLGLRDQIEIGGALEKPLGEKPAFSPGHPNVKKIMKVWDSGRRQIRSSQRDRKYLEKYGVAADQAPQ